MCNAAPLAQAGESSGRRREDLGTSLSERTSSSLHQLMRSNRRWCSRRRASHMRARRLAKGRALAQTSSCKVVKRLLTLSDNPTPSDCLSVGFISASGGDSLAASGDSGEVLPELPPTRFSSRTRLSSQIERVKTGLNRALFLMSRCYGTRLHDKCHSLRQLRQQAAKPGRSPYQTMRRRPAASSVPGHRSAQSFLTVGMAVCFPRRRRHLRDFFFFLFFFFFTWEFLTTSGPMLGYRPNHRTAELLI